MKTKRNVVRLTCLRLLMGLSVISAVLVISTSCSQNKNSESAGTQIAPPPPPPPPLPAVVQKSDSVYQVVDEMPVYPGGDAALLKYLAKNTTYPVDAKEKGIQGKVVARFCVNTDGSISKVTVVKAASPELDMEAIRVVKTLPAFQPGKQGGKPVPVWYMVPINFTLQ